MTIKKGKERDYNILFLIDEDQKIAHMDISFSKDPAAVLRKHIRGEIPETEAIIFRMKMEDIPRMWVWEAGRITRGVALTYLQIWQTVFQSEGYEVIGTLITEEMRERLPQLSGMQKWPLRNVGVESLLHGKIAKRIESENAGRDRRSALQKFTVDATDEVMRIRVKENTAYRFRCFCKEKGITQNQGLELLLGDYTDIVEPLIMDLQKRLEKANSELEKKEQEKEKLREALRKAEEGKEYPKIIQAAKLQNQLLCELIKQLPIPDLDGKEMLWRYSSKQGTRLFPEGKEYSFPEKEGVIDVNVEHMQYSKGHPSCLFLFCRSENGEKIKIRWYREKNIKFGEAMYDSPYLWVNSPWKLAVRKDGDAMELVGSVPNLYKLWFEEDEQISEEKDDLDWEVDFALNGMDIAQEEGGYNPDNEEQMCDDEKTSQKGNLDDLILAAERMRRK